MQVVLVSFQLMHRLGFADCCQRRMIGVEGVDCLGRVGASDRS